MIDLIALFFLFLVVQSEKGKRKRKNECYWVISGQSLFFFYKKKIKKF